MSKTEVYEIRVVDDKSIENRLSRNKNPALVAATIAFINSHFNVKIGDIVEITYDFEDYHGADCFISVEHFVPIKNQFHKKLLWKEKTKQ